MLEFSTSHPKYEMDLLDEIKLFFLPELTDLKINHQLQISNSTAENTITIDGKAYKFGSEFLSDKQLKRVTKHAVYLALKAHSGKHPPWGSLTGVRPTKLAYEFLGEGGSIDFLPDYLVADFDVTAHRAHLIKDIVDCQSKVVGDVTGKVNLYIHVPFCPSRCNYCSFPSAISGIDDERLSRYTDFLVGEIESTQKIIEEQNKTVLSVYIGGGTPTILSSNDIGRILDTIKHLDVEKTFEAGRPDSITEEKLETLKKGGITRVCINPQALSDATLHRIGRSHTAQQFFEKFALTRTFGFDINTDLIAGLDGENVNDFEASLKGVLGLSPENITIHTLSRKRASDNAEKLLFCDDVGGMMDLAQKMLPEAGYYPYYLYKQKYMIGNLENIGYTKKGKECINNISVMEEFVPVYACGAGAISKKFGASGAISRFQNAKDVKLYIEEFDIRTAKKHKFLSN